MIRAMLIVAVLFSACLTCSESSGEDVITGVVSQLEGDFLSGEEKIKSPAENVVVYAIPVEVTMNRSWRADASIARVANAYGVTNKKGQYSLPVTPGRRYRVVAMVGPGVFVRVGEKIHQGDGSEDLLIDKTTN